MNRFEANKTEMNSLDFGNLIHAVVEKFGRDESIRDSDSEKDIADCFAELLDKEVFIRFGNRLTLALLMQVKIAHDRLRALAKCQAGQRALGWKIIDVELAVGIKNDSDEELIWKIDDHPMTMMLDRVERNEHNGEIRVMDYKTSAKASAPEKAHLVSTKTEENKPILGEMVTQGRSEKRWSNLQLPLYAWFAMEHYKTDSIPSVGYIQLPNALSETAFTEWEDFDTDLLESAKAWTREAIKRIEHADFFQPANLNTTEQAWDDYAKIAHGDISAAFGLQQ